MLLAPKGHKGRKVNKALKVSKGFKEFKGHKVSRGLPGLMAWLGQLALKENKGLLALMVVLVASFKMLVARRSLVTMAPPQP